MSCILATLLAAVITLNLQAAKASERKPNIVFFLIDDLGWADLGCYGSRYHLTPNIDSLAASGMRFTDAYAACPVCSPTRASIMTGKHPVRLGITDWIGASQKHNVLVTPPNVTALPQSEVTFAETLKDAGYFTAYFGKWHLGSSDKDHPSSQGFDFYKGVNRAGSPGSYHYPFKRNKKAEAPSSTTDVPDFKDAEKGSYLTDLLAEEASKFVKEKKGSPFLLMLSHYSVHTPIQARSQDVKKFSVRLNKIGLSKQVDSRIERYGNTRTTQNNPIYAAMVESVDRSVGKVMDVLRELGLIDDTIVIFTSDNGGLSTLNNKRRPAPTSCLPLRAGKGWLYEGGVRVPTIVSWPGVIEAGRISTVPIVSSDFYPTLLTAAQLPLQPSQHLDGIDLNGLLRGRDLDKRSLFWHFPHYHGSANRPSSSIRKGNYKLIRWHEDGSEEMFDLANDISESTNIASSKPSKRKELAFELSAWIKESGAKMAKPNPKR